MSIDIEKEREAAIVWAERHYRNVDEFTRNDLAIAVTAWLAAKSTTQPAPIPVQAEAVIDGPTEREISILRFALRRLSLNAHALANEAAQDKDGRLYTPGSVEAFQRDAEDAERLLGNLNAVVAHIKAGGQGGEDGARLDWMAVNEAWIAWNCELTRCRVFHQAEDGELRPIMGYSDKAWASSPREAIDAARATPAKANDGEKT